jgi:hypothetical protein
MNSRKLFLFIKLMYVCVVKGKMMLKINGRMKKTNFRIII